MSEPGFSPSNAFDREKSDFHYLTVEARDDLGRGNRNSVELLVHLVDVNDNAPKFSAESYETSIAENDDSFAAPFVVRADDRDENGTENAQIR
jgi:cadherin 23